MSEREPCQDCGHDVERHNCDPEGACGDCRCFGWTGYRGKCDALRAKLAASEGKLIDVHDALHRECDGTADLPGEIRGLREKLAAAESEVQCRRAIMKGADGFEPLSVREAIRLGDIEECRRIQAQEDDYAYVMLRQVRDLNTQLAASEASAAALREACTHALSSGALMWPDNALDRGIKEGLEAALAPDGGGT